MRPASLDPVWSISNGSDGMINVRRSTPRNAPPVINAVFNYRNFWDGRAQSTFNGVNPFGAGDPGAHLLQTDPSNPNATLEVTLRLVQLVAGIAGRRASGQRRGNVRYAAVRS